MKVKIICAVVLLGVLSGCDDGQSRSADASRINSAETASQERLQKVEQNAPQAVTDESKTKRSLDLTLTDDVIPAANIIEESDKLPVRVEGKLPNMFAKDSAKDTVSVAGGVIREDDNPDLVDSVQGAEVSIEFKTD